MTFTEQASESSPAWSKGSRSIAFMSDREQKRQLYVIDVLGGEAQQVGSQNEEVASFAWSPDGLRIAFLAGQGKDKQVWIWNAESGETGRLTSHPTPVTAFWWAPSSKTVYFRAPDSYDEAEKRERHQKGFDVIVVDEPIIPEHLWLLDLESKSERRLTSGNEFSVSRLVIASGGLVGAFTAWTTDRYYQRITETLLYLVDLSAGGAERVTELTAYPFRVAWGFSPDGRHLGFTAENDFEYMRNRRLYLVPANPQAESLQPRKVPTSFDNNVGLDFWSDDGKRVYFQAGVGVRTGFFEIDRDTGKVTERATFPAVVHIVRDEDSGKLLASVTDHEHPSDYYLVPSLGDVADRRKWRRLTNGNPQLEEMTLGSSEVVRWTSADGREVEGILVKPAGYEQGKRYPLIVQLHGGPYFATSLEFPGGTNAIHVLASRGYALLRPNYRGSTHYGERFKTEIAGRFFHLGFQDILSGVDEMIRRGIADPEKLGMMGWSAGGHFSNWTLTHTDRFKAISSGAGAVNWISMYAQTDSQATREFFFKGRPYDNWDHYVEMSPLRYIKNAKTPTLIHVGTGDRRVPMPQCQELHMALKKMGVPTEMILYPNMPHGLVNPKYAYVKIKADLAWFDRWILGKDKWLNWGELIASVEAGPQ